MKIISPALSRLARLRNIRLDYFLLHPEEAQKEVFMDLLSHGAQTSFGRKYGFRHIRTIGEFKKRVPLTEYDGIKSYITRMLEGEENVLWDSPIRWFAKSSGTTSDKSKFIPVSKESLKDCHYRGARDVLTLYYNNFPESPLLSGKMLIIGGSHQISQKNELVSIGDLSAIVLQNMPFYGQLFRTPELSTALMDEWEQKIEKITRESIKENVTSIAGVPSWTLILIKHILQVTGKGSLKEVWPNLELYIHGGVSFSPYANQYDEVIGFSEMHYQQTYNASEGFFAAQDDLKSNKGMLLMLRHGIFFEFMPIEEYGKPNPQTLQLPEIETGKTYGLVISTNAGLWRYILGDTIKFTSRYPFRIEVIGRLKSFINTFGEEVMVENADKAIAAACEQTGAIIRDYTAGPILYEEEGNGAHEWLIEFEKEPKDINDFKEVLDKTLRQVNSDYESKRYEGMILREPVINVLPRNTFNNWLKNKGKLGGQHKVPRLSNNRKIIEDILNTIIEKESN